MTRGVNKISRPGSKCAPRISPGRFVLRLFLLPFDGGELRRRKNQDGG
jgi:hypothetical protein